LSNDQIKVSLTSDGLLSAVTSTTTDATPQIFQSLGELAANTLKIIASAAGAGTLTPQLEIDVVIDPLNAGDVGQLNQQLNWIGVNLVVTPDVLGAAGGGPTLGTPPSWGLDKIKNDGILYRPALPYRLTFTSDPSTAKPRGGTPVPKPLPPPGIVSTTVELPNEAPIMAIDVSRAAFVSNSATIAFNNGMLTDISYNKPSQAQGLVQIPVDLSKQLLSVPNDLLTIRYANVASQAKAQTDQLTNQTAILDDRAKLLKAQTDLVAAEKALKQAQQQQVGGGNASPAAAPCTGPICP
jgi:hypothetical protein